MSKTILSRNLIYPKPNIVLSKCLGIAACRYNGHIILDKIIDALTPHVNYVPLCPEEEIGLGTPRDPIRLVDQDGSKRLVQPKTGKDVTNDMVIYSQSQSEKLSDNIDGFILKDRSPSCGINGVKVYSEKHGMVVKKSMGLFAEAMKESFPELPMENEGRLSNKELREHFLSAIFTLSRFKEMSKDGKIKDLQKFHAQHKYLFMGYNQGLMRELGKIAANSDVAEIENIFNDYYKSLLMVFKRLPRKNSQINIFLHNFGYFKKYLDSNEKIMFLELLEKFRNNIITSSTIKHILNAWIVKYNVQYLADQYWFAPFPEELISLPDSGKNRIIG